MKPPTVWIASSSPNCLLVRPTSRNAIATVKIDAAQDVEVARRPRVLDRRQQPADEEQRDEADGDVDVEDPVPADVLGQEAADERADDEGDAEDGAEQALVLAALGRREQVADDGERDREERTGADALDAAEQDELRHVLAQAGQRGADQEDADADHEDRLAPVEV